MGSFQEWMDQYLKSNPDDECETISKLPIAPLYSKNGPIEPVCETFEEESYEFPGQYPFTRGPYASMYRSKLWTMRLFAGFATAPETNKRFKELLEAGGTGLSCAFDLPTLMGRDSDDPKALGEVGKCGVAVDTLADFEDLFDGINLEEVTTSMTINGPAAILLAMYFEVGKKTGRDPNKMGGTLQNDIFKEYQAQKEYIFPVRPSLRLVTDTIKFCSSKMKKFHPISVSGYHIREAGSSAVQELAFTLANGFAYLEAAIEEGEDPNYVAKSLSFFFNSHIDFFEEIAKLRAARRIWATWLKERYGIGQEDALKMRFHVQTAGCSLTKDQVELNIVRTAIEALAGVLGGTQSLHTNSMDEVLALPTDKAARIALRTQQIIAYETNVANTIDPLAGSYYVEYLTNEIEAEARQIFEKILDFGQGSMKEGVIAAIEEGWFQGEIAEFAYYQEKRIIEKKRISVSVNDFFEGNDDDPPEILYISAQAQDQQIKRLYDIKGKRSEESVKQALKNVESSARDPLLNLMEPICDAVRNYATLGEIVTSLGNVFGYYEEPPRI